MTAATGYWARRRAGVAAEAEAERRAEEATAQETLAEKSDEELLAHFDLPDPDTLQAGDDFSAFMAKAIPDRLRRRALRRLWRSNPVLANVDNLVDYGEDYTDNATVLANLQTTYQVGKGMLEHVKAMARQVEAEGEAAEEAAEVETELTYVDAEDDTPAEREVADEVEADADASASDHAEFVLPPRRMKFRPEATA